MAGVQIDGVNNKIDFDDDLDTSISANTDDTLVIEAGGNTMATITATTFTINDGTTITTADNTDTLTLKSTDADGNQGPILRLNRDSGSPADGDVIGEIHFNADDDAGNTTSFFSMSANIRDASNGDEDVQMVFKGFRGGNNVNYLEFDSDHVVFNEGGANIDLRVETTGSANMLIVDAGANAVYVNTDNSAGHISGASFAVSGNTTLFQSGNSDNLTLLTTDADANVGPNLVFNRNSSSPADNDDLGKIVFKGRNDNSQDVVYAQIRSTIVDASDGTEDGLVKHDVSLGGTAYQHLSMGNGSIVFNEESQDIDFRVESNSYAHCLFVDGGNDRVGVGEDSDIGGLFRVSLGDSGVTSVSANAQGIIIEDNANAGMTIATPNDAAASIFFADPQDNNVGEIQYNHSSNHLAFNVNAAEGMRITSSRQVLVGATSGDYRFEAYNAVNGKVAKIYNGNNPSTAAPYGLQIGFNYTPNNGTSTFLDCEDTLSGTTVNRLVIYSNGDVFNRNNEYGQISDARIKDNITDANSQWDDIKAIKVRNFELKDDIEAYGAGNKVQIGVVAQELESVSPGLIKKVAPKAGDIRVASEFGTLWTADDAETKDGEDAVLFTADDQEVIDGENSVGDIKVGATHSEKVGDIKSLTGEQVKGVSYSVLYMKAIKALQEAQTRIETLETKVAALEG